MATGSDAVGIFLEIKTKSIEVTTDYLLELMCCRMTEFKV